MIRVGLVVLLVFTAVVLACTAYAQISPGPIENDPVITFTPPGEIIWKLMDSQGDEIVEPIKLTSTQWQFDITPDPSKLTQNEIEYYPFELYRLVYTGTGTEPTVTKVPIDSRTYTIRDNPKDSQLLSSAVNDRRIDLSINDGITIIADPSVLDGAFLKVGPHSAVYSGVSNIITVTGSPVTYQDIYDADVVGGWGVFFQSGGTQQFYSTAKIYYGDDSTPTHLIALNTQLSLANNIASSHGEIIQQIETNAIVTLGTLDNSVEHTTMNGCSIINEDDNHNYTLLFNYSGGAFRFYDTHLQKLGGQAQWCRITGFTNTSEMYGCSLNNVELLTNAISCDKLVINKGSTGIYNPTTGSLLNRIIIHSTNYGFYVSGAYGSTFTNCEVYDALNTSIRAYKINTDVTFIDTIMDDWTINWADPTTAEIYRQYKLDALVITASGTTIQGANVVITNNSGTVVSNVYTSASGTITSQLLNYGYYSSPNGNTPTLQTPHTIRITAYGYQDYETTVTMDKPQDLIMAIVPVESGSNTATTLQTWMQLNIIDWMEADMEFIAEVLIIALLFIIALWAKSMFIYIITSAGIGLMGAQWWDERSLELGLPIILLAAVLLFRGVWQPLTNRINI